MKRVHRFGLWTFGVIVNLAVLSYAVDKSRPSTSDHYEITRGTVDGGVMHSSGGDFELSGTIGQADAGTLTGGDFELTGGFWFALAPGDCNEDGGVNVFDHHTFAPCMTGPNPDLFDPGCVCFDADRNLTVDLRDAALFQNSINTAP